MMKIKVTNQMRTKLNDFNVLLVSEILCYIFINFFCYFFLSVNKITTSNNKFLHFLLAEIQGNFLTYFLITKLVNLKNNIKKTGGLINVDTYN